MGTIVYGSGHVKSSQGIIKVCESVICLIGLLIVATDGWLSQLLNAFFVGTAVGLTVSLFMLILHISKAAKPIQKFIAFQLYFNFAWFVYLLIVSAILLSRQYGDKYMAGGSFGIIAAALYLIDAIDCYRVDPSPNQIIGTAYLTTLQGACKVVEVVCSFIGALLVGVGYTGWVIFLFELAAAVSIIVSTFLFVLYVTGLIEKLKCSWNRIQFFFHILWAIYYLVAAAIVFDKGGYIDRLVAGGVFGLLALIAHLVDGIDNYRKQPLC